MASPIEFIGSTLAIWIPLALILFGIFTAQVYFYVLEYDDDPTWLRVYVVVVWLAECIHSAFCLHMSYTYLVLDFGNVDEVVKIVWTAGATVYMEVVIVALIQAFFIYRAWTFSKRKWIVVVVPAVTLFLRIAFSFTTATLSYFFTTWPSLREAKAISYTFNFGLCLGVLVDIMIAAFLIYELLQVQSSMHSHFNYVQKFVNLVFCTGALTVLFSVAIVLTFNILPKSMTFVGLVEIISKLYANTMMANLNSRKRLRSTMGSTPQVFESIEFATGSNPRAAYMRKNLAHARPVQIRTETTTETTKDSIQADESYFAKTSIV